MAWTSTPALANLVDHLFRLVRSVNAHGLVSFGADHDVAVIAQAAHVLNLVDGDVAFALGLMMDWHFAAPPLNR